MSDYQVINVESVCVQRGERLLCFVFLKFLHNFWLLSRRCVSCLFPEFRGYFEELRENMSELVLMVTLFMVSSVQMSYLNLQFFFLLRLSSGVVWTPCDVIPLPLVFSFQPHTHSVV